MRICRLCAVSKPLVDFVKAKKYKDGYRYECKMCWAGYMRQYNAGKIQAGMTRAQLKRCNWQRHGLTEEQYETMQVSQNHLCKACQENAATDIDHDHACCVGVYSCGKCVRGILCGRCNRALGAMEERVDLLQGLIHYMSLKLK